MGNLGIHRGLDKVGAFLYHTSDGFKKKISRGIYNEMQQL